MSDFDPPRIIKGRGAASNRQGRFEPIRHTLEDDGWSPAAAMDGALSRPRTQVSIEHARSVITRNDSPDIGFDQAVNPYRGCEHGCVYCYARPSHAYLNLSPGLDFETRLFAKSNAAEVLRAQLARPGYRCSAINIGSNTDPYQPLEKRLGLTRQMLEVMAQTRHPCTLVTKNALVERDIDVLTDLARDGLVLVLVSCASLDNRLAAALEPRASAPHRRLKAIERLCAADIPTGILTAPMIPALNDADMEKVIERAAGVGARCAGYTVLRLPHELKTLFAEWLELHAPRRKAHVLSVLSQMHGGRAYDAGFGRRMHGSGPFAELLRRRFEVACRRHGLHRAWQTALRCDLFRPPRRASAQGELF